MNLHFEIDDDPRTLDFIARENAASAGALHKGDFAADTAAIREMIEREDKLLYFSRRGDWLYTFRQTAAHPRGVWQRLPADAAPIATAPWETVFDLDAYCLEQQKTWIWRGAVTCPWAPSRVLLSLSDGGSDLRLFSEFDCDTKAFVEGGFQTPLCRSDATWLDHDEILFFGSVDRTSATSSGWPRVGRRLKRGEALDDAPIAFEAKDTDVTAHARVIDPSLLTGLVTGVATGTAAQDRLTIFSIAHTIGTGSHFIQTNRGPLTRLDLPVDSDASFNHRFVLWLAKTDERYPTGTLILDPLPVISGNAKGDQESRILFSPADRQFVTAFRLMREWCVFTVADAMRPRLFLLDLTAADAQPFELALPDDLQSVSHWPLYADLPLGDDTLQVSGTGFLLPPTLYRVDLSDRTKAPALQPVAAAPAYFDAAGMTSLLLEATSEDGTQVPYRLVLPRQVEMGELPVLLYGYGGFEASLGPFYSGVVGRWLSQGGAYVQAHIRGGGEFGPDWHRVAKRDGRHRAFADFAAVARDLVSRGYSRPERIACNGGSNGGLLTGVMMTRYPELFGAVWCQVPVLDMLRFHTFPAGRAWMDEYGDPDNEKDKGFLLDYSPLHKLRPSSEVRYPPIYIESSSNDDRVHPSHARRFAQQMRDLGHAPLFHEFTSGGHGGEGDSGAQAARAATGYSFLKQTIMKREV